MLNGWPASLNRSFPLIGVLTNVPEAVYVTTGAVPAVLAAARVSPATKYGIAPAANATDSILLNALMFVSSLRKTVSLSSEFR
jgi:hypothetical protein